MSFFRSIAWFFRGPRRRTDDRLLVFISEEFGYLNTLVVTSATTEEICRWWRSPIRNYTKPLPGEIARGPIWWDQYESGALPADGDEFCAARDRLYSYRADVDVFVHVHCIDDSFMRLPGGKMVDNPQWTRWRRLVRWAENWGGFLQYRIKRLWEESF